MQRINVCFLLMILLVGMTMAGCGGGSGQGGDQSDDAVAIRACFAAYRDAVTKGDGEAAAAQISADTLAYYTRMRDLAFDAPADEVKALSVADKLLVLSVRQSMTSDALQAMDGLGLFVHTVKNDAAGNTKLKDSRLGQIEITDGRASGVMLEKEEATKQTFMFSKEGDAWKINLTHARAATQRAITERIEKTGVTEDELLLSIVAFASGQQVRQTIWEPLNPEKKQKFDVVLTDVGDKKIQIVTVIREATKFGLLDAKALADNTPSTILQSVSRDQANALAAKLKEQGGTVELK